MTDQPDLKFAAAMSQLEDCDAATEQVVSHVLESLPQGAQMCWLFVSMEHADALRKIGQRLRDMLGGTQVMGCTCAGVVGVGQEVETGPAISVLAGRMPGVRVEVLPFDEIDWPQAAEAPQRVREALGEIDQLRAIVTLADPYSTPMVTMLPAMTEATNGVPVVGGMASGGTSPRRNRLLINDTLIREGAVGVTLHGNVHVQTTVSQGARPIGGPLVITQAKRHVVQKLGGHNALNALRGLVEQLEPDEQELVQTHGVLIGRVVDEYKPRFGRGDFVIRGLVGVDPKAGYLAIGDPQVRVGQTIQFHVRDAQAATDDFLLLLEAQRVHGDAAGALMFTCNGRGKNLFDQPNADASMVSEALKNAPMSGFFAAGEIGPIGDANYVHGHTVSLIVFRPRHER